MSTIKCSLNAFIADEGSFMSTIKCSLNALIVDEGIFYQQSSVH